MDPAKLSVRRDRLSVAVPADCMSSMMELLREMGLAKTMRRGGPQKLRFSDAREAYRARLVSRGFCDAWLRKWHGV